MSDNKYSFRNEIKLGKQKEKEEKARKDFNRNKYGLYLAAVVFFIVLLVTLQGIVINSNMMMLLLVASLMGVFYFGRELRVLPKCRGCNNPSHPTSPCASRCKLMPY